MRAIARGRAPAPDTASVLVEADMADMVKSVLDCPVVAGQVHQPCRSGFLERQSGDEICALDALAPAGLTSPLPPRDLRRPGPVEVIDRLGRDGDAPGRHEGFVGVFDEGRLTLDLADAVDQPFPLDLQHVGDLGQLVDAGPRGPFPPFPESTLRPTVCRPSAWRRPPRCRSNC